LDQERRREEIMGLLISRYVRFFTTTRSRVSGLSLKRLCSDRPLSAYFHHQRVKGCEDDDEADDDPDGEHWGRVGVVAVAFPELTYEL